MARYVLSKDNDKIILTDTKTGKKRVLTIDDIDYVVDDNQKLRDENTIATYFRLKEEDFKPKTITKKANLVQEYKQALNKEKADTFDYVADFLNKAKLIPSEIKSLAELPDESTINKFDRTPQEKTNIIRLFQEMKSDLDKKKVNTFDFIKSYLNRNQKFDLKSKYDDVNHMVHDLIPELPKETKINNLQELYDMKIKKLGNIDLEKLNDIVTRLTILNDDKLEYLPKYHVFRLKNILNLKEYADNEANALSFDDLKKLFNDIKAIMGNKFKNTDFSELLNKIKIGNINRKTLDERFKQLINLIANFKDTTTYFILNVLGMPILGMNATQFKDINIPELANKKLSYFDNLDNIEKIPALISPDYIKIYISSLKGEVDNIRADNMVFPPITKTKIENIDRKKIPKYLFNMFIDYVKKLDPQYENRVNNDLNNIAFGLDSEDFAGGWTDKTLTRIDVIIDTLKGMGIGMGWSDRTLTRIDNIMSQLNGMGLCSGDEIAGGWTDKTLTRIDNIFSQLNGMGLSGGWTDKTLTRIDDILSQLM